MPAPASEILDRVPPYCLEAERSVVGSCLLIPEIIDDVILEVQPGDFHDAACAAVFQEIANLHVEGKRIDENVILVRLKKTKVLPEIDNLPLMLADLTMAVGSPATATQLAREVREKATLRRLLRASMAIMQDCWNDSLENREVVSKAEQRIFAAAESGVRSDLSELGDVLTQALGQIRSRKQGEVIPGSASTGLADLDKMLCGLKPGTLNILAGRPSMGKSALAGQIADHMAVKFGKPVYFASLEMGKLELAERFLCSRAKVSGHRARAGFLQPQDHTAMAKAMSEMSGKPLVIDDSPTMRVSEIAAQSRRIKRKLGGLGLIVIDYLQLIEPDSQKDVRQEQVAKIARRLKAVAREINVPVLCLAQLNRQAELGTDHKPKLSQLRESGAIEQDADTVMFVHREEYYISDEIEKDKVRGEAEIILAKHRNGPIGTIPCCWQAEFTTFVDRAGEQKDSEFSDTYEGMSSFFDN